MNVLVPCPDCARHVRASDATCPFCSAALPADLASRAVPAATKRMSRGATYTFAVTLAVAGAAAASTDCSSSSSAVPLYGAPSDSGVQDGGGAQPLYGAAFPDGGPASDASADDSGGAAPLYGLPQFDGGIDAG